MDHHGLAKEPSVLQPPQALWQKLTKYEMYELSPTEQLEYKRLRKNQQERARVALRKAAILNGTHQPATGDVLQKKKAKVASKNHKSYQKRGSFKNNKNRKNVGYVPLCELSSDDKKEKRRAYWRIVKANQRRQHKAEANLAATDRVVKLEVSLAKAEADLDDAKLKLLSPPENALLGVQQTRVDTIKERFFSKQQQVDCYLAGDVEVDAVTTSRSAQGNDGQTNKATVDLTTDSKTELNKKNHYVDNDDVEIARYGTLIELMGDSDYDIDVAQQQVFMLASRREQSDRRQVVAMMRDNLQQSWAPEGRNHTALAHSRANKIATCPGDKFISELWKKLHSICPQLQGEEREATERKVIMNTMVVIRSMEPASESNTIIATNMTARDYRALLTPGDYITDSTISFYSALLAERDLALSLRQPSDFRRSAIYSPFFYTSLTDAEGHYQYHNSYVSNYGSKVPGGNIFALDKLLIPINIQNHHFFTIGVFFQSRIIQVFDSKPDTSGRLKYLEHIFQYLKDEQETTLLGSPLLVDWESWSLTICSPGGGFVPTQGEETNDCGVFTCLFMDYLMLDLSLEQVTQEIILKHGREHVCSSILNKLINF